MSRHSAIILTVSDQKEAVTRHLHKWRRISRVLHGLSRETLRRALITSTLMCWLNYCGKGFQTRLLSVLSGNSWKPDIWSNGSTTAPIPAFHRAAVSVRYVQISISTNWISTCRNTKKSTTASQYAERRPKNMNERPGDTKRHVRH